MGRGVQQHTKYDNNPILRGGGLAIQKMCYAAGCNAGWLLCWLYFWQGRAGCPCCVALLYSWWLSELSQVEIRV